MADENADWSADSNDAVHVSLVVAAPGGHKTLHSFHPKMTYSIFGDEERIFGYQGLKINIRFNACDMRPGLQITYNKKFKTVGETEPADVKGILEDYLPKTAFAKATVFDADIANPMYKDWKPPGELWRTIQSGDKTYEIWKGSLADAAVQQMIKRIQLLVPFYIEGGTFIELNEPDWSLERWTIFFLYEKRKDLGPEVSPYVFMGYCTVYRYFFFQPLPSSGPPNAKKQPISHEAVYDFTLTGKSQVAFSALPCRTRISQFVILPPFQGSGSGSRLYNAIFDYCLESQHVLEITVEDPNEAFDDLRDLNDLARLRTIPEFTALRINTACKIQSKGSIPRDIMDLELLEKLRRKMKIAPRQFARLVEMQLLSLIPTNIRQSLILEEAVKKGPDSKAKEHEYHLWQLYAKKRLYKHNKDMLAQLDRVDRIEKLEQALGGVEADYARLLRAIESRSKPKAGVPQNGESSGKRSSPDEAEDEDDDEPAAKKTKFA